MSVLSSKVRRMLIETAVTSLPSFLSIPTALIAIPILLLGMGETAFGLLLLTTLFVNHSHVLLFGLDRSQSLQIAKTGDETTFRYLYSSASLILLLIFLACAFLYWLAQMGLFEFRSNHHIFLGYTLIGVAIHLCWALQRAYLLGREKFNRLGVFNFLHSSAHLLIPTILSQAAFTEAQAQILVGGVLLFRILTLFGLGLTLPSPNITTPRLLIRSVKQLLNYGKWLGLGQLIVVLQETYDRFVLSLLLSPAQMITYMIPLQLTQKLVVVPQAFAAIIFPKIARSQKTDFSRLYLLQISLFICFFLFLSLHEKGLQFWLKGGYRHEMLFISATTFAAMCFAAQNYIITSASEALGNARQLSKIDLKIAIAYFLTMIVAVMNFGAFGAAMTLLAKEALVFFIRIYVFEFLKGTMVLNICFLIGISALLFWESMP